jgi:hypothetical protein
MTTTRVYFSLSLFCLLSLNIQAQIMCKGVVLDSLTKEPLEFANIGIPSKGIGSVSNEKGEFQFTVPDSLKHETLRLSIIGYKSVIVPILAMQANKPIFLAPASVKLDEVVINPKKIKIKILGNETRTKTVSGGFKSNLLGAEMGIRLNIKHADTYLRKLMFQINSNTIGKSPIFRVNVYAMGKDGLPGENILKQNIIIEPNEKIGLVEVDLKPYSIFVSEDVFITLEWIKDLGDAKGLYFSTKLIGSATYFRQASQDRWEKATPIGVGLHVEVGY